MAIKKVQLPNNSVQDINDARVVSDAIVYKGEELGDATYTSGGAVVDLSDYQPLLVSGTSIKTINNESLLGSGNISISGGSGGGGEENVIEVVKQNGTALTVTDKAVNVTVPTKVSDLTNDSGFITSSAISGKEDTSNKVSSLPAGNYTTEYMQSHYPSLYYLGTALGYRELSSNKVTSLTSSSTDTQYPSAKCVYDTITGLTLGDANVIEGVTFNGTTAPITNKIAAITASIPTESTVSGWGFTKNAGTLTGVTFNGTAATVSSGVAAITATIPNITISSSEPTSSDGSNGDIWIVV